jgi:hypothetical protein
MFQIILSVLLHALCWAEGWFHQEPHPSFVMESRPAESVLIFHAPLLQSLLLSLINTHAHVSQNFSSRNF